MIVKSLQNGPPLDVGLILPSLTSSMNECVDVDDLLSWFLLAGTLATATDLVLVWHMQEGFLTTTLGRVWYAIPTCHPPIALCTYSISPMVIVMSILCSKRYSISLLSGGTSATPTPAAF